MSGDRMKRSLLQAHKERWGQGCGASECDECDQKCFKRGKVPCEILFIGEAPGISEDACGECFVGPAGHLLDRMIRMAGMAEFRVCMTNLVLCLPSLDGKKVGQPDDEQVKACAPRLVEFVRLADPKLIVCVGNLPRDWLDEKWNKHIPVRGKRGNKIPTVHILHPAFILRQHHAAQSLHVQKEVLTLSDAVEEIFGERA